MKPKDFCVAFKGLKDGAHQFEYRIGRQFFEEYEYQEFLDCQVTVKVDLLKSPTMLEFDFRAEGEVEVPCDLSNEPYMQEVRGDFHLVVKFGEAYSEEDDELLIIPHGEYEFELSQFIYDLIVLSVPSKRVHPGILDGTMTSEILDKLEELAPGKGQSEVGETDKEDSTDPRWDDLKKLLNG